MRRTLPIAGWRTAGVLLLLGVVHVNAQAASVTLRWSAPGDDGLVGRAVAYDLRYSTLPITAANFLAAARVPNLAAPQPPGATEVVTISVLQPGTAYYFAVRSVDEAQNWSAISNVPYVILTDFTDATDAPRLRFSAPRPNPARQTATWSFALPKPGRVEIEVFEVTGRKVRAISEAAAGAGEIAWDLRDDHRRPVPSGVYLVRARLGGETRVQRIAVAR